MFAVQPEGAIKMKKSHSAIFLAVGLAFVIGIFGLSAYITYGGPDGRTIESREELIAEYLQSENSQWKITAESEVDGYMICAAREKNGKAALVVLEPSKGNRYKIYTMEHAKDKDVMYTSFTINNVGYDAAWFTGEEKTEYAEITYKPDDGEHIVRKFDTSASPVIYTENPLYLSSHYSFSVVYYDSEGNTYCL